MNILIPAFAQYKLSWVNENSVLLHFGNVMDNRLPPFMAYLQNCFRQRFGVAISDFVPSYTTLLIIVDTQSVSPKIFESQLIQELDKIRTRVEAQCDSAATNTIEIPVCYDPAVAPDLERMASTKHLTIDEFIDIHSSTLYTVYTLGFLPGFAFMGAVDARIAEPRLSEPRAAVAAGSVGIAGSQTGIYPQQSPGGWNIIGKTHQSMIWVDQKSDLKSLLMPGDRVLFKPISLQEFLKYKGDRLVGGV